MSEPPESELCRDDSEGLPGVLLASSTSARSTCAAVPLASFTWPCTACKACTQGRVCQEMFSAPDMSKQVQRRLCKHQHTASRWQYTCTSLWQHPAHTARSFMGRRLSTHLLAAARLPSGLPNSGGGPGRDSREGARVHTAGARLRPVAAHAQPPGRVAVALMPRAHHLRPVKCVVWMLAATLCTLDLQDLNALAADRGCRHIAARQTCTLGCWISAMVQAGSCCRRSASAAPAGAHWLPTEGADQGLPVRPDLDHLVALLQVLLQGLGHCEARG